MEQTHLLSEKNGERATVAVITVGGLILGAIFGAIFLAMLYRFASSFLNWPANPPHLHWYSALVGAGVGGVQAFTKSITKMRRKRATRAVADELGLEYATDVTHELEDELDNLFGGNNSVTLTNAVHRTVDSARLIIADMRYHEGGTSDSNSNASNQTVAYFSSDQLQFPSFELRPERKLLTFFSNITGIKDIDFDDYPEFSKQYHLFGWNTQPVRALFDDDLLRHFTGNPGWHLNAANNSLAMFRPGTQIDPSGFDEFIQEAMETFSLFMAASYAAQDADDAALESEPLSQADKIEALPSLLGKMIQSILVSPVELKQFLAAPTPRRIPKNILRQRMGEGSLILAVFGCVFLAAGIVLPCIALLGMTGPLLGDRIMVMGMGAMFLMLGSLTAFFAIRYRHRNYRLLRHGIVAEGKIEAVERTDTSINNQRQYRLKVRFPDGLDERTSTCNIYGEVAQEAIRLHREDQPVRVLYDRKAPQRFLWADSFAIAKL